MELHIVKYLKEHGLEKTISNFRLKHRDYGHKVLLKYDQIAYNFEHQEVRDCRGLILEKGTWNVMSLGFRKFFNLGELHADPIDWESAKIYQKVDGSFIQVYYDWVYEQWCVGTSGTAHAEKDCNGKEISFSDLFKQTLEILTFNNVSEKFYDLLNPNQCYIFELCTPFNTVVKEFRSFTLYLLGSRNMKTLKELSFEDLIGVSFDLNIPMVLNYRINADPKHLTFLAKEMPFDEEGYVVRDKFDNRVKIKSPAYVEASHVKASTAGWRIMNVIITNELDEFLVSFPERKEQLYELKAGFEKLLNTLEFWVNKAMILKSESDSQKDFASKITQVTKGMTLSIAFTVSTKGYVDAREWLLDNYTHKDIYKILTKNVKN